MRQRIQELLDPYDSSQTECDGMTRICHTVGVRHGIDHQPRVGLLQHKAREIEPHFWIDLPNGDRIDYRARMWLGQEEGVPHGVFNPQNFPDVIYQGEAIVLESLPPVVLSIMTLQFDALDLNSVRKNRCG
jgi:hypothetical protein